MKQIIPLKTLWKQIYGGSVSPEQTVPLFSPTVFLHMSCIWNMDVVPIIFVCSIRYMYVIYVVQNYLQISREGRE